MKRIPWLLFLGLLALLAFSRLDFPGERTDPIAVDRFPRITQAAGSGAAALGTALEYPLRIENPEGENVEVPGPPQRVLPGNAGVVDFLSVLVEPGRVPALPRDSVEFSRVGRTASSDWMDLPRFREYAAEDLMLLRPDLVIGHAWQHPETHAVLARHGVPVLTLPVPRNWEEVLLELRLLGRVLGETKRVQEVETQLERRRERLTRSPTHGRGLRVLTYSNFGAGGFTAGRGTTVDIFVSLAGVTNAASEAGLEGHAQLDYEHLLTLDPDAIVLASRGPAAGKDSSTQLKDIESLAELRAVRTGCIAYLDPAVLTTTSLELMRAAEDLQRELERLFPGE